MDLREYARVFLRRGWMVMLIALIGALGAIGFSRLQTPIYRSTIKLSVLPARPDWGQSNAGKTFLRNYSLQIVSSPLLQQVIDQMQLDVPPETLRGNINVSAAEDELTISIEAKHPKIEVAQELPQRLAQAFVEKHRQENNVIDQRDRINVELLDNASPVEQFSPKTKINALAGGILGGLVGAFVVFLLEFLQSAFVRNSDDVERFLGLTVLGSIPIITGKEAIPTERVRARRWFWQRA